MIILHQLIVMPTGQYICPRLLDLQQITHIMKLGSADAMFVLLDPNIY